MLARKLGLARMAAMGRLGKADPRPVHGPIAAGRGRLPLVVGNSLGWWEETLPSTAPRMIMDSAQSDEPDPVRVYSDATSGEGLASMAFLSALERPAPRLLVGRALEKLRELPA